MDLAIIVSYTEAFLAGSIDFHESLLSQSYQ